MYGPESWKINKKDENKINGFHNRSLRRIMKIFWPKVISNVVLKCQQQRVLSDVKTMAVDWTFFEERKHQCRQDSANVITTWKTKARETERYTRRMVEKERNQFGWRGCGEAACVARKRVE